MRFVPLGGLRRLFLHAASDNAFWPVLRKFGNVNLGLS